MSYKDGDGRLVAPPSTPRSRNWFGLRASRSDPEVNGLSNSTSTSSTAPVKNPAQAILNGDKDSKKSSDFFKKNDTKNETLKPPQTTDGKTRSLPEPIVSSSSSSSSSSSFPNSSPPSTTVSIYRPSSRESVSVKASSSTSSTSSSKSRRDSPTSFALCPQPAFYDIRNPIKAASLSKRGGSSWNAYYFILKPPFLFYYKSQDDKKPLGVLYLPECSVREESNSRSGSPTNEVDAFSLSSRDLLSSTLPSSSSFSKTLAKPVVTTARRRGSIGGSIGIIGGTLSGNSKLKYIFSIKCTKGWNIRLKREYGDRAYVLRATTFLDMSEWMSILSKVGTWDEYRIPALHPPIPYYFVPSPSPKAR